MNIGKMSAVAFAATGAAVIAAGKELVDLAGNFDAAYDSIRIGTGATGDDLTALKDSMKNVYSSVPTTMEDASSAIADYNTRLELTGSSLETLSGQAIQVSDMLGEDLSTVVETSSQAFQQWGVTEDEMSGKMDYLFKVSQNTGIGFGELTTDMQRYGAQLQDMGYSFDEAAALCGQLEKAGVNTDEVLGAMKKSVTTLAKDGLSASEGMEQYCDAIKRAGTEAEATAIASEVFGTRAGSTMAAAIRDGSLSVADLTASLQASQETIGGAAEDTYDFSERLQMMKQNAEVAFEPMAMALFDGINELMPTVQDALSAIMPIITELGGELVTLSQDALSAILPVLSQLIRSLLPPIVTILRNVLPIALQIIDGVLPLVISLIENIIPIINALLPAIDPILDVIIQLLPPILQVINLLTPLISMIGTLLVAAINRLSPVISLIGAAIETITPIIDGIISVLSAVIDFVTNVFAGNWEGAWQSIVDIFSAIWDTMKAFFIAPLNYCIKCLNYFIEKINSISIELPDWSILGEYAGTTIGFSIPTIPEIALASGGIVTQPTTALVGEGSEPEGVFPLSKLSDFINTDGGSKTEIVYAPQITIHGNADAEMVEEATKTSYAEFVVFMQKYSHERDRVRF